MEAINNRVLELEFVMQCGFFFNIFFFFFRFDDTFRPSLDIVSPSPVYLISLPRAERYVQNLLSICIRCSGLALYIKYTIILMSDRCHPFPFTFFVLVLEPLLEVYMKCQTYFPALTHLNTPNRPSSSFISPSFPP